MEICELLPEPYRSAVAPNLTDSVRELRFRVNRECVLSGKQNQVLQKLKPSPQDMQKLLVHLCDYAIYAHEEQLRNGYLTLKGGHRAGISGSMVMENGAAVRFNAVQGITIRIARQVPIPREISGLFFQGQTPLSVLILSPPGLGKTTLLREIAKTAGDMGIQTSVSDERGELAACYHGVPQLDVGMCTDVLDALPKHLAIPMLLRAMAPQLILCDEVGSPEDRLAIMDAVRCGVKVVCSAHGNGIQDVKQRANLRRFVEDHLFDRIVVLGIEPGRVCAVYTGEGKLC